MRSRRLMLFSGNMFGLHVYPGGNEPSAICIPTNGYVTPQNNRAVMGAGIAKQAVTLFPGIDLKLGELISRNGHHTQVVGDYKLRDQSLNLGYRNVAIVSLPSKPVTVTCNEDKSNIVEYYRKRVTPGLSYPGFYAKSSIDLITQSLRQLLVLFEQRPEWSWVALPMIGSGHGGLPVQVIRSLCMQVLHASNVAVEGFILFSSGRREENPQQFVELGDSGI